MRKWKKIVVTVLFFSSFLKNSQHLGSSSTCSSQPEESMLGVCGASDYGAGSAVSSVLDG